MTRIRYLVLAAIGGFVALPVVQVYTVGAPWIEKMELRNNDLVALQGKGVPGTQIDIFYRQRNFAPGCAPSVDFIGCIRGGHLDDVIIQHFVACDWLFNGSPIRLGSAVVGGAGTWRLQGLDTQVLPGATEETWPACAAGVLTQIELHSPYGDHSVPEVVYLQMREPNAVAGQRRIGGQIVGANQVAAGVADGPNDVQDATAPWTVDTAEDGTDTCTNGSGCGAPVGWRLGGEGTFQPPSIEVRDESPLVGPRDQEFNHVMGTLQGHKPGGSVLAVAYGARPTPIAPLQNINVNLDAGGGGGPGCDASGGYFDFFP